MDKHGAVKHRQSTLADFQEEQVFIEAKDNKRTIWTASAIPTPNSSRKDCTEGLIQSNTLHRME